MNNFLMWVGGGLAAALFALFAVPPFVDWNQYRGVFEEEVSRLLGREVRVGGRVSLRILPVPYVGFEKVRIADAPGIPGSFLSAERFTMLLSVPPLLRGVLEARQLEIDEPKIRLRFDETGGGNWQKLEIRKQELAFVPSDIALQSARIRGGQIALETATGRTITKISDIEGELTAGALRGPYKFGGSAKFAGTNYQLRLATGTADPDGSVQVQAAATANANGTKHTVQGRLSDLDGAPRLRGELQTKAPLILGTKDAQQSSGAQYDLRANLALGSQSATLSDIAIAFDSKGRPQQLTGKAEVNWRDGVATSTTLKSKWLDIDAITGGQTSAMPLRALQLLSGGNIDLAAPSGGGSSELNIAIEQANLGGEVASDLDVRLTNANGELRLDRIAAALPGGTRLRADGLVGQAKANTPWQGHVLLSGSSLARFLSWASPELVKVDGRAGGAFRIAGQIKYTDGLFEMFQSRVRIANHESKGNLSYRWSKSPKLAIDWNAETLDLSGFGATLSEPQSLANLLGLTKPGRKGGSIVADILGSADLNLRLRANKVQEGKASFSNLDVLLSRSGERVEIGRSRLTVDPGLEIEIEGKITTSASLPSWRLNGLLRAGSAQSTEQLHKYATAILGPGPQLVSLPTATPVEVAFSTRSERADKAILTKFEADGSMGPDRLRLRARSAGPIAEWRTRPLTIDATIDGQSSGAFFSHLGLSATDAPRPNRNEGQAQGQPATHMRFRLSGIPAKALRATAQLRGEKWRARLRTIAEPAKAGEPYVWRGTGHYAVTDLAEALPSLSRQWASLLTGPVASGGHFAFSRHGERLVVEPIDLNVGRSTLSGQVRWGPPAGDGGRPQLSGALTFDRLEVATLLAPLIKRSTETGAAQPQDSRATTLWPDLPFELKVGSLADANLKLKVRQLEIQPEMKLANASMTVIAKDGSLEVADLTGKIFGGEIKGDARLAPAAAGVSVNSRIELSKIKLDQIVSSTLRQRTGGLLSGSIAASGQALSPRALMTAIRGDGRIKLSNSRFPGLDAQALSNIADGVVLGEADVGNLNIQLAQATANGSVEVGNTAATISVSDGTLQVSDIAIGSEGTRAINQTTIDIVQLAIDSQWRIDTALTRALKSELITAKQLPPVQVVYAGAIDKLSSIKPTISLGDLQRELTVQRMEHDVKRLERLRREDEERAKSETERLQRLEQARIRALEEEARKRGLPLNAFTNQSSTGAYPANASPAATTPGSLAPSAATPSVSRETLPPVPGQQTSDPLVNQAAPGNTATPSAETNQAPAATPRPRPRRRRRTEPPQPSWNPFSSGN